MFAVLAEVSWLVLGNRPVFSSLDIRHSYVFSRQFNLVLNGASLWLCLMGPIILAISDYRYHPSS